MLRRRPGEAALGALRAADTSVLPPAWPVLAAPTLLTSGCARSC